MRMISLGPDRPQPDASREETRNLISRRIEGDRVRPHLRLDCPDKLHPLRIHDIDDAGITYRHVETAPRSIEEDDIRRAVSRLEL